MPTATDLVTDLPADFEVFGQAVATSMADLLGGTSGQVLAKNSNTDMDFVWVTSDDANAIQNTIVDAKGDLIGATANDTPARLAVGANDTMLIADSTAATGLAWKTATTQFPWTTYTPTLTNITIGNGTVIGRYQSVGKTVNVFLSLTLGSTSSFTGGIAVSVPVAPLYTNEYKGLASLSDNGVGDYPAFFYASASPAVLYLVAANTSGTYISGSPVNATTPFTWTTSDRFTLSFTYEAA